MVDGCSYLERQIAMKLHILFGQRKERYEGEHAPEALVCWDEYSVEENGEGFDEACVAARKSNGGEEAFAAFRVIDVTVDGDKIRDMLVGQATIIGTIKGGGT